MSSKSSGIKQDNALLKSLLSTVLQVNGWTVPLTDSDVIDLEDKFKLRLEQLYTKSKQGQKYTIRTSTLRRLLNRETYNKSFDIAGTLNPLARLAGFESWSFYVSNSNTKSIVNETSELFEFYEVNVFDDAENLNIGATLKMGWYPNRYIEIKYLGNCEFEILKYVGTGQDRTGNYITARWFEIIDVPSDSCHTEITKDIAGVLGGEIYERIYL